MLLTKTVKKLTGLEKVNLENFAKFVDGMENIGVRITEGNPDSDYNSWIIYKME